MWEKCKRVHLAPWVFRIFAMTTIPSSPLSPPAWKNLNLPGWSFQLQPEVVHYSSLKLSALARPIHKARFGPPNQDQLLQEQWEKITAAVSLEEGAPNLIQSAAAEVSGQCAAICSSRVHQTDIIWCSSKMGADRFIEQPSGTQKWSELWLLGTSKWSEMLLLGTPKWSEVWLSGTHKRSEIYTKENWIVWDFLGYIFPTIPMQTGIMVK